VEGRIVPAVELVSKCQTFRPAEQEAISR
jgi:hypothetical protein